MSYLAHHGVKGQKWGVKNGPPYPIGSSPRKVFISGTSKIKLKDSGYYRNKLPKAITDKVDSYMKDNCHILIGDAPGIDTEVQKYLAKKGYKNVTVYTISKDKPRSYSDSNGKLGWGVKNVSGSEQVDKDKAMSKDAHMGFAIILEKGSSATRDNIERMDKDGKDVEIFSLTEDGNDHWVYSKKYQIPTDRLHSDYNLDSWGTDKDHNILYITGFSGSGKSTLAEKMARENNANLVELDIILSGHSMKFMKEHLPNDFMKCLSESNPNWKDTYKKWVDSNDPQSKYGGKHFDTVEDALKMYGKNLYNKNKKLVTEGIQIMDGTLFYQNRINELSDKPVIIMNTDVTQAYMSAVSRDKISVNDAIDPERINWYGSMFRDIQYLNNLLKTPINSI